MLIYTDLHLAYFTYSKNMINYRWIKKFKLLRNNEFNIFKVMFYYYYYYYTNDQI